MGITQFEHSRPSSFAFLAVRKQQSIKMAFLKVVVAALLLVSAFAEEQPKEVEDPGLIGGLIGAGLGATAGLAAGAVGTAGLMAGGALAGGAAGTIIGDEKKTEIKQVEDPGLIGGLVGAGLGATAGL